MSAAAWWRTVARRLTPCLVLVSAAVAAPPASALSVTPGLEAGVALPSHWASAPAYLQFASASSDYVAYSYGDDEFGGATLVHRASDGAVVGALPEGATLAGSSYLHQTFATNGLVSHIDVTSVATGAQEWSVDIPAAQSVIGSGEAWVVTQPVAGGTLHLLSHSGDHTLTGLTSGNGCSAVVGDASAVVVNCGPSIWSVAVPTGSVTTVTTTAVDYTRVLLSSSRVFWVQPGNGSADTVHWRDRSGATSGSIQVQVNNNGDGFVPYGDTLLERVASDYVSGSVRYDLDPVDLATGAVAAPVVSQVTYSYATPEGVTLAVAADSQAGRVVAIAPGATPVRTVATLPLHAWPVTDVYYSGARVGMAYEPAFYAQLAVAAADGTTGWTDNVDGVATGSDPIPGVPAAMAGDTVATQPQVPGCRLTWPGGHRDLATACGSGDVTLGHGGRLVKLWDAASSSYDFESVRQPGTLLHVPWNPYYAMDGTTVWKLDPASGVLTGTDLIGTTPRRTVSTGVICGALGALHMAGRWALLECNGGYTVVDLLGLVPPWQVPVGSGDGVVLLGGQFVAWTRTLQSGDQPAIPYLGLVVTELASQHRSHVYGPVHDLSAVQSRVAAVDDAGSNSLVYLDTSDTVRRVDLGWVADVPTTRPDTTAPVLSSLTGTSRSSAQASVTVSWTFVDPGSDVEPASGLATYDVRSRQAVAGGPEAWQQPVAWQGLHVASVVVPTVAGETTCLEVRAHDVAGNVSAWSREWCSAPVPDRILPSVMPAGPAFELVGGSARFSYAGQDDVAVSSYDVSLRAATDGRLLGTWATPARWHATSARSVSEKLAVGAEACFRVRARDSAGNVSAWSAPHCVVRPLDDRQLSAHGVVRRVRARGSVAGTASVLAARGASLSTSVQRGWSVLLSAQCGRGQGTVEVRVGQRVIGVERLGAKARGRCSLTVHAAKVFHGVVTVRSVSAATAWIDAVAVLR